MKDEHVELLRRLRSSKEYWKRFSLLLFTTDIHRLMKNEPVPLSAAKLAKRIGVKAPVISNWLRGGENLTVETMNKIAAALDAVVYIHVAKKGLLVRWIEEPADDSMHTTIKLGGSGQNKITATLNYEVSTVSEPPSGLTRAALPGSSSPPEPSHRRVSRARRLRGSS